MTHLLDDPAWWALTSHHAHLAEVAGPARRYRRGVSIFNAVDPDAPEPDGWAALATLVGPGGDVVLARATVPEVPADWRSSGSFRGDQLVADSPVAVVPSAGAEVRDLGADDVPAMVDLVGLARPGPFFRHTNTMGRYVGVFDGDRLVAMAGERMRLSGHSEVSAVCTHPDARGRGLGALITSVVAAGIQARGDLPFLHVADGNHTALRLYQRLGFAIRSDVWFTLLAAPAPS